MDIVNKKYNRLLVLKFSHVSKQQRIWECKCNCGNITFASTNSLRGGNTKSCGCLQKEKASVNLRNHVRTHNLTYDVNGKKTRLFRIWRGIKTRCYNKNVTEYSRYGGKGVILCDEWMDYKTFYQWAISNGYKSHLTIDRINNDGDYEPSNCRWATIKQQARNRKNNRLIEYKKECKPLAQLAEEHNMTTNCLWERLNRGWSIEKSLITKVKTK